MMEKPLNKIWEWIKAMVYKIADLIPRRFRREVPAELESSLHMETPLEKELGRKIQKRQAREVERAVDTRQGGPNMPKYQHCPNGHGQKRRRRKTMGGAYYNCGKCGDFFVRAPSL